MGSDCSVSLRIRTNTLVSSDPVGHEEPSKLEERAWEVGTNTPSAAKLLCVLALWKLQSAILVGAKGRVKMG